MMEELILENGTKRLHVALEVADMSGKQDILIGMDLFPNIYSRVLKRVQEWADNG